MTKSPLAWEKRILLPLWTLRTCLLLTILTGFSAALRLSEQETGGVIRHPYVLPFPFFSSTLSRCIEQNLTSSSTAAAFLTCLVLIALLDIAQVILWARNALRARYFVVLAVPQAVFWFVVLVMDGVGVARGEQAGSGVGLVVVVL